METLCMSKRNVAIMIICLIMLTAACQAEAIQSDSHVSSTATSPQLHSPTGTFEPSDCWFEVPEDSRIDCGFVRVPADYERLDGKTLRLATVILYDESEGHQPDPVLLLAGGPGERVAADALKLASIVAPIHPNRDLVIFDQRGVGLSQPALECPEFLQALFENLDQVDNAQAAKHLFESLLACRDRFLAEGIDLTVFNTYQSAADVEAIRVALGYEDINIYGASYGSLLAQVVMREYPEHIRSAAMNSVLPIEKSIFLDTSTTASQAILDLLEACEMETACSQAYPHLKEELFDIVDRFNREPIAMTLTHPLTGDEYDAYLTGDGVVGNLFTFLYVSRIIPVLPQAVHNLYEGDYTMMQQLSSTRLAMLDSLSRGTMLSVLCRDDLIGRTPQDQLDIRAALPDPLVNDIGDDDLIQYGAFGLCKNWPVEPFGFHVKEALVSDIPSLLLAGEFDPITPPDYAQMVAERLAHGYLFELQGMGHDVLSNTCAHAIIAAFMEDPHEPPDALCFHSMPELSFDVPKPESQLTLRAFSDEARGFEGLVPAGWEELAPANLARRKSALDPAYFVLEGASRSKSDLFADLTTQLGLDASLVPAFEVESASFQWAMYTYDRGEVLIDIALTELDGKAYFVLLVSPTDEYDQLHSDLFMPAVEAMRPLSAST